MAVCLGKRCQFRCMRCVYPTRYPLPLISLTQVIHTETLGSPGPIGIREKGLSVKASSDTQTLASLKIRWMIQMSKSHMFHGSKWFHLSHFKLILISPYLTTHQAKRAFLGAQVHLVSGWRHCSPRGESSDASELLGAVLPTAAWMKR